MGASLASRLYISVFSVGLSLLPPEIKKSTAGLQDYMGAWTCITSEPGSGSETKYLNHYVYNILQGGHIIITLLNRHKKKYYESEHNAVQYYNNNNIVHS